MTFPIYPSDLTDREWQILLPLLPRPKPDGRPRSVDLRCILNGIFYLLRSGCAWRMMPREYGPWSTVYSYFWHWRRDGTLEQIHAHLREQVRHNAGREPTPSAAIIDSQTVKTTEQGGPRGYDGAKKIKGRKRHLVVDTQGLLLRAVVHPADLQDRAAIPLVLTGITQQFPRLTHVWVDQGYTGSGRKWMEEQLGWTVEVVQHPPKPRGQWVPHGDREDLSTVWFSYERFPRSHTGFRGVLPRRWVVERTIAWIGRNRRMSKDYESIPASSEAMIYLAMIRLMIKRLARDVA